MKTLRITRSETFRPNSRELSIVDYLRVDKDLVVEVGDRFYLEDYGGNHALVNEIIEEEIYCYNKNGKTSKTMKADYQVAPILKIKDTKPHQTVYGRSIPKVLEPAKYINMR